MTCPRCYAEFEEGSGACPDCGVQLLRSVSGVMKTSAVMIAAGGESGFYRSVQEVPEPLRTQLIEVTNSANSGTIVIADRAGKEQITQVIARRESPRGRSAAAGNGKRRTGPRFLGFPWIFWAGIVLFLMSCGIIAAVFLPR